MKRTLNLFALSFLVLASVCSHAARAETIDCTAITSLPYTITAQGVYCLTGNLSTSITTGNAIEIQTNNVTIDLNGYKLGGLGAGPSTEAHGIHANQRKNITIKNGIVRGFFMGISLMDSSPYTTASGNVVKGILADQNTYRGIDIRGTGNMVSHNTVVNTGGSTLFGGVYGIIVGGPGAKVVNNVISTTTAQGASDAIGIMLPVANYSLIQNNTVTDTTSPSGITRAIYITTSSAGVFLRNNNLANAYYGIYFSGTTGKYFNNLTFDVTTPFTGGTAVGGNNN